MKSCAQVIPRQENENSEIPEADISLYLMLLLYSKLGMYLYINYDNLGTYIFNSYDEIQ